jgi:hypothetical protein
VTTLMQLRAKARNFVKDTIEDPTKQKVSDEEVNDYILYAIADYSSHFPRSLVLAVDPPLTSFAAPVDMVPGESNVDLVEVGGKFWAKVLLTEGVSLPTSGNYYYWRGGQLTLSTPPSSPVYVHYRGLHLMPAADEEVLTVPLADEEFLVVYAAAKFHQKMGTVAAKLDRFKEVGRRDDNPLVFMHDVLLQQYNEKLADRMHRGTVRVRKA